jgi:DNA modification methylase
MKLVKITDVKPNPKNPRIIKDDKFQKLVKSIQEFPDMLNKRPLVVFTDVDNKYVVLGGNMRLKACKEIGLKEIPIIVADEWTEEQKNEFLIKDNVGFGEWDWDSLANEWDAEKLDDWGLDLPVDLSVQEELEAEEDNYEIPNEINTDIVIGDLFEIGEHRLLCGDSTDSDDVAKLMNGQKSELLFTSPPYSDMREYNGNKDLSIEKIIEFITSFYQYCEYQVINLGIQRKEGQIFEYWNDYIQKAKDNGYLFLSWNIWNRENAGFSIANITSMFATQHEWIFVFGKKVKKLNLTIENKEAGNTRNEVANRQKDGSIKNKKAPIIRDKRQLGTINTINPQLARDENVKHPAMFPIELPSEYIKAMTNENEIISEPFLGSGTTMVASHQIKRKCYGMELDPKYCQVIIDRMKKLDPSLVIKKNGVEIK